MYLDYGPELAQSYNKDYVYLLPVNSTILFVYWETRSNGKISLIVKNLTKNTEFQLDVKMQIGNWYLKDMDLNTEYACTLRVEKNGKITSELASNVVRTPRIVSVPTFYSKK